MTSQSAAKTAIFSALAAFLAAALLFAFAPSAAASVAPGQHEPAFSTTKAPHAVQTMGKKKYKVIYHLNGGKNAKANPKKIAAGKTVKLKSPTRAGYAFKGWYTTKKLKSKTTKVKGAAKASKRTVWAKWSAKTYRITYVLNGGTQAAGQPSSFKVTTKTFALKQPTRAGYDFAGWYGSAAFAQRVKRVEKGTVGNLTLYAKWNARDASAPNPSSSPTSDPALPAGPTPKGTIAAVGEYATITQMLGGAGALAACDEAWLNARAADGCFSGELDRVQAAFSGDGTAVGSCDVSALTGSVLPSVVLWDSVANEPNLTEADRAALENAGITVQQVPHIGGQGTEDYYVRVAAAEVASVLTGASGLQYDPASVLAQYNEFHDAALKTCYDANGGYSYKYTYSAFNHLYQDTPLSGLNDSATTRVTTVYVDDLLRPNVDTATFSQSATTSTGTVTLNHDGQAVDVTDGIGLSSASSLNGYQLIDYYLQLAGVVNNAYDSDKPNAQGRRYILTPGSTSDLGTTEAFARRLTGSAFFFNSGDATVESNWHALGDADFCTVLTANNDIASAFARSAAKADGLYNMGRPYRIIVVPSGIAGSWAEGHIDSFLLSPWAFRIQDEGSLDAAQSYASAFYRTFFRCNKWREAVQDWDSVSIVQ